MPSTVVGNETPVLPAVAARVLRVSPKGLRWLADNHKLPFVRTGGSPSIRLYRWGDVLWLLERRGRVRAMRAVGRPVMLKAQLRLPLGRVSGLPTSAAQGRGFSKDRIGVA